MDIHSIGTGQGDCTFMVLPDGTTKAYGIPDGFERQNDAVNHTITISGVPTVEGDYKFVVRLTGLGGEKVEKTLTLHATAASGISIPTTSLSSASPSIWQAPAWMNLTAKAWIGTRCAMPEWTTR